MSGLVVYECGLVPYEPMAAAQRELAAARARGELGDLALVVEHPPTYTTGRRSEPGELPMGAEWYGRQGIEVVGTDRGGRVTYHGPGQLVVYPIVRIGDVRAYVAALERAAVDALGRIGIEAQVIEGLTGIWTAGAAPIAAGEPGPQGTPVAASVHAGSSAARKIGSIGIHISRGVTTHGLAINVNNDLQPFEWIVPCGIDAVSMTSACRELGAEQDVGALALAVCQSLADWLETDVLSGDPLELGPLAATPAGG